MSNRPDTGSVPGPKGSPRGSGESVEMTMGVTSAPAGTLDAAASVVVNGPRDFTEDWDQVNWARVEDEVRRLRQRIFTASRAGEHRKVRSLQRLMLRSRANALLSTRRVAQVNQGRRQGVGKVAPMAAELRGRSVDHDVGAGTGCPVAG